MWGISWNIKNQSVMWQQFYDIFSLEQSECVYYGWKRMKVVTMETKVVNIILMVGDVVLYEFQSQKFHENLYY